MAPIGDHAAHDSGQAVDANVLVEMLRHGRHALALQRLLAVPLFAYVGWAQPGSVHDGFTALFVAALLWEAITGLWMASARWRPRPMVALLLVDVVLMGGAIELTGASTSELRFVALVMVPIVIWTFTATQVGILLPTLAVAVLIPLLIDVAQGVPGSHSATGRYSFVLAMTILITGIAVWFRARTHFEVIELNAARRRLLGQVLSAEAAERQRLSEHLHDGPLQHLIAACQDLEEAQHGVTEGLPDTTRTLENAIGQLRETVHDLHPLAYGGQQLPALLRALLARHGRAAGFQGDALIDSAATGVADDLLFAVARELLANAAWHADAGRVTLILAHAGDGVHLQVSDDGVGMTRAERHDAVSEGHIGLVSCRERVRAAGGSFAVVSKPGEGTRIVASIPLSSAEESR